MREAKVGVVVVVEATGQSSGDGVHLGFAEDGGGPAMREWVAIAIDWHKENPG